MITIKLSGVAELVAQYKNISEELSKALDEGIDLAAENMVSLTQKMPPVNVANNGYEALGIPVAPKYGGTMRSMIHTNNLGPMKREIVADTNYAVYVHDGTYKMRARPFFNWALDHFGGRAMIEATVNQRIAQLLGNEVGSPITASIL